MKAARKTKPMQPGDKIGDDTYIGIINVNGVHKGILLPPKAIRQPLADVIYNKTGVKGALSYCDGLANTRAMARAGSEFAHWALDNKMHIPSQDELEIVYRICKPTTDINSPYNRSGMNVSAVPPTYPYQQKQPKQTTLKQFRAGGPEAFDTHDYYWTSTRHQDDEDYAWMQDFKDGYQDSSRVGNPGLGCAVRVISLQ